MLDTGLVITTAYIKPFTNKKVLPHSALEFVNERPKGFVFFVTDLLTFNVHVHSCLCCELSGGGIRPLPIVIHFHC